jgi:SAM-dependent methyltransferase
VRVERERRLPPQDTVEIIDRCAARVAPDREDLLDWHQRYVANHKSRLAHDLDIVRRHVPEDSAVLECGSIPPVFTLALQAAGYRVTGCDLAADRYAASIARANIRVATTDIETERLPFDDDVFDAVVFNELFEHLRINPIAALSEVRRVLKPDGLLMLSTPNLKSLEGLINFLARGRAYSCCGDIFSEYHKLNALGHMGHVREYTTVEVKEFLGKIGFRVTSVIYRGWYFGLVKQGAIRLFPRLRPFVSYVAAKKA